MQLVIGVLVFMSSPEIRIMGEYNMYFLKVNVILGSLATYFLIVYYSILSLWGVYVAFVSITLD